MEKWEYKLSVKFPFHESKQTDHYVEKFILFHIVRINSVVHLSADDAIMKLHGGAADLREPGLYLDSLKQLEGALHCTLDGVEFTALNLESLEKAILAYDGGNAQNNWARVIDIVREVHSMRICFKL